jgi:hypothetical protein
MTARREALFLPLVFLTVFLLGGFRIAATTALTPPGLFSLVLAILLLRVLIQSGTLAPGQLLTPARSLLENLNGVVVLFSLWAAAAQTFAMLIPESGLPRLAFNVLFLVVLLNTAAAAPDRLRLMRSLGVMFGATFVLKFVVLYELSKPGTSWLSRVLQAMVEGVTPGTLVQDVPHPITGYLALLSLILFLVGVFLLPFRHEAIRGRSLRVSRGPLQPVRTRT